MSNRYFKIPVQVKPYVKKYIVANYGDSILMSVQNPASMVLYGFLNKKNLPFIQSTEYLDKRFSELTATIFLHVQLRDRYKHGLYIHKNNHLLINSFFEDEIIKMIHTRCNAYRLLKLPKIKAIDDFCAENNIELDGDISLEGVLKAEYRYRKDRENILKKVGQKMSDQQNTL